MKKTIYRMAFFVIYIALFVAVALALVACDVSHPEGWSPYKNFETGGYERARVQLDPNDKCYVIIMGDRVPAMRARIEGCRR